MELARSAMSSDSIGFSILATTGSHSPASTCGVEQESKDTTFTPPFAFGTPTRDTSKRDSSDTLESPRRKKYSGNISSSIAFPHLSRSTGTGPVVSTLNSPPSIFLARIDSCNVPTNEFILAMPNQVFSLAIQYPTPITVRPRATSISTSGCCDTDPSADPLNEIFLKNRRHRSPRPTSSGYQRTTTTTSRMFLPITEQDLQEGLLQVEEAGFGTTDIRGFGLRMKPAVHYGTRPWDPI